MLARVVLKEVGLQVVGAGRILKLQFPHPLLIHLMRIAGGILHVEKYLKLLRIDEAYPGMRIGEANALICFHWVSPPSCACRCSRSLRSNTARPWDQGLSQTPAS